LPSVSHTPSTFTTCSNSAAFTLSGGSPAGGTYTGPGVTGTVFNPASVGIGATTLLYSYTDGNGCSASVPVVIFVNAPPAPVIATIPAFCPTSAPHTLSATPAGGIFSGTGVSGGVFDPAVAGIGAHIITYTYTSGGCTGTATATANVSAAGAVTFGALTDVCLNAATYPLTTGSPAGGTYSGSGVSGGAFYANVAGAGTHTLTYTYTSGTCTGTATQTITVHALPSVSHTPSTFTTCSNSAAFTLSGGSPAGGTYTGPGVTGTVFNPASVGIGATTLLYSYTDGNGCSASVPVVIFVNAPPAPVIATIPALCLAGGTHTLSATPTGGAFSGTGISGGVFDPALAGVGMHIISYTFTSGGCTGTATRNVFVIDCSITSSPAPTVPSYLIVEGIDTETLRLRFPDSNSDEDGYEIYRSTDGVNWVLHVTTSAYTTAEIVYFDHVNTLADEKYFYIVRAVRGTKRSGFTNSAYDYTYPHAPSVTVLQAACRGGVGKFKAVGTHEGNRYRWYDRETGGEAYRGSDGNAFDGDIFTTPSISGTTTFYVTAKGKRYESKPRVAANMTVVEKANVSIIGGTDKKVCGNAVNLAVEPVSGITLQWYLNGLLISGATGNTYTATENGIYLVFADNGSCRTASAQMNVVLNYRSTALIKQGKTATFCESGTLSAKFIAGAMYSWQKDGEVFGDGIEINVSESGTYTLTVREYGCENTAEILVKVHQFPDNIALSAESTAICPGESVLLTTDIITGATYNWYKNGILFAATNDATLSVRKGGRYSVAPVLGNNCQKQSAEIILTETKPARLTSNFDGETLTVTLPEGLNAASIQWTIDGEAAASLDNLLSFKPTKNGLYTLRIVWENGCETSMSKKIILGALGTDNGEDILSEISIYPNPANAKLFISFGKMPQNGMTTRITDNIGRVMQVGGSFESDKLILDISSLPVGLYILQIKAEGVEKSFKFVKE
jgi:hypothetical protein